MSRITGGRANGIFFRREAAAIRKQTGFFERVKALPDYRLEIEMKTDTLVVFNFNSRLCTAQFGALKDTALFNTAHTNGDYILFGKEGYPEIIIAPADFIDLALYESICDDEDDDT
jgi:hypothetical protein